MKKEAKMTEPAAALIELKRIWNSQDREAIAGVFAADAVFRDMAFAVQKRGLAEIRELMYGTWRGIPDLHTELTRLIPHGDWVASEWTLTGTHTGDFPNLPATGRSISIKGVSITQVQDGKIVSQRDYYDRASFLEQLGVLPGGG
jgi:steroid delta-isomerase-like uncharacterized protein